jgi:hypothetical protein
VWQAAQEPVGEEVEVPEAKFLSQASFLSFPQAPFLPETLTVQGCRAYLIDVVQAEKPLSLIIESGEIIVFNCELMFRKFLFHRFDAVRCVWKDHLDFELFRIFRLFRAELANQVEFVRECDPENVPIRHLTLSNDELLERFTIV